MKKPIRTALLSYGMSGEVFHGPLLRAHPGFEISAIFQRDRTRPPKHLHKTVFFIEEILGDPDTELVVVNTPNETHYPFTRAALEAGKHVIVEKPFTVTSAEADELISLARKKQRVLSVFHNRRWDGGFLTVQKILREQMLGRVVEFEVHYDRYRNYIEPDTWKEVNTPGTGILYNLGSHMLDQVLVLFGMPLELDARMGIQRTGGKIIDYYDIRMGYEGLNVIVKSSYLVREPGPMYRVNGTAGSFVKSGIDPQEQALKENKVPGHAGWGEEPREWWGRINTTINGRDINEPFPSIAGNYLSYYDNIFIAIREGKQPAVTPEQARDVIRLIEACIESDRKRCAVRFDNPPN